MIFPVALFPPSGDIHIHIFSFFFSGMVGSVPLLLLIYSEVSYGTSHLVSGGSFFGALKGDPSKQCLLSEVVIELF